MWLVLNAIRTRKQPSRLSMPSALISGKSAVLCQLLPDIEKYVGDLRWIEVASGPAKRSLNSRPLTAKEAELFTKVVAEGYRRRLRDECAELNCMLPIEFKTEAKEVKPYGR